MPKSKIEIIDLNLGFDPRDLTTRPQTSEKTIEKAKDLIAHEQIEQKAIQDHKERLAQENQKKDEALEACLKKLIERVDTKETTSIEEVLTITGSIDPVGIMIRLRNLIKRRGSLWEIKKTRAGGKTQYFLVPTLVPEINGNLPTPPPDVGGVSVQP